MRAEPCALRAWSSCSGFVDTHTVLQRAALSDRAVIRGLSIPLCRLHRRIDDDDPILAERLGIRIPRWAYDLDPKGTVAWCAATRAGLQGNYSDPYSSYFLHDRTPPWRDTSQ